MYVDSYAGFAFETELCESEPDRRNLHEIKGVAGTLGMKKLALVATDLDKRIKQGGQPGVEEVA
ncbi:MAG: Hpt domain-containing protein [Oceanospirillales bacterium]|nr:Hpt domain-containing protein [Oceanospirillales bacterium]